jgi:hypothetical protein
MSQSNSDSLIQKRLKEFYSDDDDDFEDDFELSDLKLTKREELPFQADNTKQSKREKRKSEHERIINENLLRRAVTAESKLKNNEILEYDEVMVLMRRNHSLFSTRSKLDLYDDTIKCSILTVMGGLFSLVFGSMIYVSFMFFDRKNKHKYRNVLIPAMGALIFYMPYDKFIKKYKTFLFFEYIKKYKEDILNPENYEKKSPFIQKRPENRWDLFNLFKKK